MSLSPVV